MSTYSEPDKLAAFKKNRTGPLNPNWGRRWTKEQKEAISKLNKGRVHTNEERIKISEARKGKQHTEETCKKIGESHMGLTDSAETKMRKSVAHTGERCTFWKGGVSFEPYCPKFNSEFKERVRSFFGYTCVECGTPQNGKRHTVHHINYDKMMCCNDIKPLFICLCNSCNAKANYNRPHWEQHFTEMIEGYYEGKCYFTKDEMIEYKMII